MSPYRQAILEILKQLDASLDGIETKLDLYIFGGCAINYYTDGRVTADLDVEFSRKFLPEDVVVNYQDENGKSRTVYLDKNFNSSFTLLHDDYQVDSEPMDIGKEKLKNINVFVISPLDLALSKIPRMTDQDLADIYSLAQMKLIKASELKVRAEEALVNYVGNINSLKSKIEYVCKRVSEINPEVPEPP